MSEQRALRCTIMRGGTSRALFFREEDLPAAGPERELWLRLALGTQDPKQVDGLGGAQVNTSKVAIISPPSRSDADVDYLSGIAGIGTDVIHYDNACGNIMAAVGPYAIEEGLVRASGDSALVRIYNRNERAVIEARVPLTPEGKPRVRGDFAMAGVPGTGAPIVLSYHRAIGEQVLPTGSPTDQLEGCAVTLCHAGALCLLVRAEALGVSGAESPAELNLNLEFLRQAWQLHQRAGEKLGLVAPGEINQTASPFVVCVAPAPDAAADYLVRVVGLGRCHPALAATVAVNLGVACQMEGTVLPPFAGEELRLQHPTGIMTVATQVAQRHPLRFHTLGYTRTARKLMEGQIYLPVD